MKFKAYVWKLDGSYQVNEEQEKKYLCVFDTILQLNLI